MDVERSLVSKVAANSTIDQLIAADVRAVHFADPECRAVFETCADHMMRYRAAPSFQAVRDKHPTFSFAVVTDSLDYVLERFVAQVKRRETRKGLEQIVELIERGNHDDMLNIDEALLSLANNVARTVPSGVTADFSSMALRIADYKRRAEIGQPYGIRMGIPALDEETFGVQGHEFVSIVGWQGTGKSTLLTKIFFEAWEQGKSPLIFSLEMGADELMRKFDIMALNRRVEAEEIIKHRDVKALSLTDDEIRRWEELASRVESASSEIQIVADVQTCSLENVHAEAVRRRPDLIGIDYLTLMDVPSRKDNKMWETVTHLTKGVKRMSRSLGIATYGIAQTNASDGGDEGAKLNNIAYSRSIGQDSDIVLGLWQNDEMRANSQMQVRMLKNRDGRPVTCEMYWNPSTMQFRPWNGLTDQYTPKTSLKRDVEKSST